MPLLTQVQIEERLRRLGAWTLEDRSVRREFRFAGFGPALGFVNRVGALAEAMDHHPDVTILYDKVILTLSTHSAGGLTEKDFDLAERIDRLETG